MPIRRSAFSALSIVLCFLLPASAFAINVDDPEKGVFLDEWFVIQMSGKKAGHSHMTMERVPRPGEDVIVSKTFMHIEIRRGDMTLGMTMDKTSEETLDGQPLSFSEVTRMGNQPIRMEGVIREGKLTVKMQQFGTRETTKTYTYPKGALMSWGAFRASAEQGLDPGTEYALRLFEPSSSLTRAVEATTRIGEKKMLDLFGRKVEAVKSTQTTTMRGLFGQETTIESVSYVTESGEPVLIEMSILDIPFRMLASTKAVALSPNEPTELMARTFVRPDQPVRDDVTAVTYLLKTNNQGSKLPQFPETAIQKVVDASKNGRTVKLAVGTTAELSKSGSKTKLPPDQRKRCLEATVMMDHKDDVVARLAREAGGDEKDPMKLAHRLAAWVGRYVRTKDLSVGFASASEVARSREGDCSEHGVLLAALGRAHGIPSRVVTGLVYADQFAGGRDIFAGHLWTQFFIDGQWIDFDATRPGEPVGPTHIALGLSEGGGDTLGDLVSSIWLNLHALDIDILEQK